MKNDSADEYTYEYNSRENNYQTRLEQLRIIEREIEEELEARIQEHNSKVRSNLHKKLQKKKHNQVTDSKHVPIEIGDTVVFLTKGGYHSKKGVVIRFTKHFVISRDTQEKF